MANLRYGSSGDEVRRLQQKLNQNGYNLAVDGVYGSQTQNAVRSYQKSKGLAVDGIAGQQTMGALNAPRATAPEAAAPAAEEPIVPLRTPEKLGDIYNPNPSPTSTTQMPELPDLSAAYAPVTERMQDKPGEYQSPYAGRIEQLYDQVMSRGPYQYDFNADPLYQMYKDQYMRQGERAMQDTMANAAALTGGYGNSYASTAGNLAYQDYLTRLNGILPELAQQDYGRWQDEGSRLMDQLGLARDMDETDYGRAQDALQNYYTDVNFLAGLAGDQYDRGYNAYADALAQQNYEREMAAKGLSYNPNESRAYSSVLSNATMLTGDALNSYLDNMVRGGYITPDEAAYIRDVELAGGLLGQAAGSGSGGGGSGSRKKSSGSGGSTQNTGGINNGTYLNSLGGSGLLDVADLDAYQQMTPEEQMEFLYERNQLKQAHPEWGYTEKAGTNLLDLNRGSTPEDERNKKDTKNRRSNK